MSDADSARSEVTRNYRTLDEPTKLLGLSLGEWGAVALAGGFAYLLLLISPLAWRVNVSAIVVLGGAPLVLLLLREQGALSASQLIAAVLRWRLRAALMLGVDPDEPPTRGVVVLDEAPAEDGRDEVDGDLLWLGPEEER